MSFLERGVVLRALPHGQIGGNVGQVIWDGFYQEKISIRELIVEGALVLPRL